VEVTAQLPKTVQAEELDMVWSEAYFIDGLIKSGSKGDGAENEMAHVVYQMHFGIQDGINMFLR